MVGCPTGRARQRSGPLIKWPGQPGRRPGLHRQRLCWSRILVYVHVSCPVSVPALQASCPATARQAVRQAQAQLHALAAASPAAPFACWTCLAAQSTTIGGGRCGAALVHKPFVPLTTPSPLVCSKILERAGTGVIPPNNCLLLPPGNPTACHECPGVGARCI